MEARPGGTYLVADKLILNRSVLVYRDILDTIHNLSEDLKSKQNGTRSINDYTVAFWGEDSIFSNHFCTDFTVDARN